jgi:hypothetical protein
MKSLISKIILISFVSFLFNSCSKGGSSGSSSTPTSVYYLECKIDGKLKTFNDRLLSQRYPSFGRKEIGIGGFTESSINAVPNLSIQIGHSQDDIILVAGTYTTSTHSFDVAYSNGNAFQYGNIDGNTFTVIITELNDTYVKGTFSGTLTDRISGGTITITEGRFYVKHCTSNC